MQKETSENLLRIDSAFFLSPAAAVEALSREKIICEDWESACKIRHSASTETLPLVWDSRRLPASSSSQNSPASRSLFIARVGHSFNAHTLAEDILARGHIFVGDPKQFTALSEGTRPASWIAGILANPNFIAVEDTEDALICLLNQASGITPQQFQSIAITGTSGKTSITQLCANLLELLTQKETMRLGTLGIQAGPRICDGAYPTMPDFPGFISALATAKKLAITDLVFEATSHGLIERRMGRWLCDVAVFINFSQDHLDFHKTMEAYRSCKGILFEEHLKESGHVVLNAADKEWGYFVRRTPKGKHTAWGFGQPQHKERFLAETKNHFLRTQYLEISKQTCSHRSIAGEWTLSNGEHVVARASYELQLLGEFQHSNLAAAVCALLARGFALPEIAANVPALKGIPGRLQPVLLASKPLAPTVLVDYAHKPDALDKTLRTLAELRHRPGGKLICVFGCGGDRDATKRPIMGKIASELADITIVTSDNPRTENPETIIDQIFAGIENRRSVTRESDRKRAIQIAISQATVHDIVVIAGKGHEDYQIIGTTKRHFSDYEEAEVALHEWLRATQERTR